MISLSPSSTSSSAGWMPPCACSADISVSSSRCCCCTCTMSWVRLKMTFDTRVHAYVCVGCKSYIELATDYSSYIEIYISKGHTHRLHRCQHSDDHQKNRGGITHGEGDEVVLAMSRLGCEHLRDDERDVANTQSCSFNSIFGTRNRPSSSGASWCNPRRVVPTQRSPRGF